MASIVELVPEGNVEKFFKTNRPIIILDLMKSYGLTREEAEDSFQEGCYALYKSIQEGRLTSENLIVRLSSYLNRCCRNHATHILQKTGRKVPHIPDDGSDHFGSSTEEDENNIIKKKLIEMLELIILDLPEPCNTILWKVYYEHQPAALVAEMLNRSTSVFKVSKNRCMNKLRKRCNSILEEVEL